MKLKTHVINGVELKYRNSDESVQFPVEYREKDSYFRGAWVSLICSDFEASDDKEQLKKNLLGVLKYLEDMNMNGIVFHLRTYNNAYYKTKLAPIDKRFGTYETFEQWDYVPWFIEECHKRGIEFHAWLNPYRIRTGGYPEGTTSEDVANMYKDFPLNPASDKNNILMTHGNGAILNPCKDVVQKYIIDVCLEIIKLYDVDAIHFDDYFYALMSENNEVLIEPDQVDYVEFIKNNKTDYKEDSVLDKKQWRRDNVDKFIYDLSQAMRKYNKENNREVQLGISPTGIYRNGDGIVTYDENKTAITNGLNAFGQEHYASYLFCDCKKWIDNEWIDYVVPQTYWGMTHPTAGFCNIIDWWDKVVKYKKVNLYAGMGIYMARNEKAHSWYNHPLEASDEVLYCSKLDYVKGTIIFNFRAFANFYDNENSTPNKGIQKIKNEYWTGKIKTPKTMANK